MSDLSDQLSDYTFELPIELIAQSPTEKRQNAKLLVVRRHPEKGLPRFEDLAVSDLSSFVSENEALKNALWVRNRSKVFPARFYARRPTGSRHEIVLIETETPHTWKAIIKGVSSFKFPQKLIADSPHSLLEFYCPEPGLLEFPIPRHELISWLWKNGEMPLPPYIKNRNSERDLERYQPIWANDEYTGSSAAPTASLHFDHSMEQELSKQGVEFVDTYLHVGLGTFEPVRVPELSKHSLHAEKFFVSKSSLEKITPHSRRHLAIGTTALRTLESLHRATQHSNSDGVITSHIDENGNMQGSTQLFVKAGFQFHQTDFLWTNFHLPESTLFVLLSCFAGSLSLAQEAYKHAVSRRYRFFSYGDASLWI